MLKWINKKRNQKGFTLIELIVVIAILGILAAIAIPRLSGFKDTANAQALETSIRTVESAAAMYYAQYTAFPTNVSLLVSTGYLDETPFGSEVTFSDTGKIYGTPTLK